MPTPVGSYEEDIDISHLKGRAGKSQLEWTVGKLLKGAGPGADPTEIDPYVSGPMTRPTRSVGTEYQNTTGKARMVVVSIYYTVSAETISTMTLARCGPSSPLGASDNVGMFSFVNPFASAADIYTTFSFIVPNNYYYEVYGGTIDQWIEYDLGVG